MNNINIENRMKEETYIVSSSKGLMIILGIVSMLLLYGGCTYIYQVISKGIAGEKILYIVLFVGIFGLFFGTLWNRVSFKITVTRDKLKVRNMFFREKEYYFNDISDYTFTYGKWNSNVNVFMEEKKIFSIDSSDNNFNRLYGDIKNEVERKNQGKSSIKENVKEYTVEGVKEDNKKELKKGIVYFILYAAFIWLIIFPLGEGYPSILKFCILFSIYLFILALFFILSLFTKIIVKGDSIILIKPPFKKKYRKMSDIEKIYHYPDHIEIYMKDYTFFSKFTSFSTDKEQYKNVDIFLKQAEESGVMIKKIGF
ncbi:DUF6560 family protein [Anaerofustis sp. NSJ-163]|uniref:DUF6560 family protein n=1 Tax=Anaerofustis sp. NSJ-163 TaxID=2944391 RepID=UPI00209C66C3|nr:DUF6560 family protein [Anaerofustis sp. NSJ-163]MCO8193715.1 hypothetical protein [Anaerofustis sp. NSJ-163]